MNDVETRLRQAFVALQSIQSRLALSLADDARWFPVTPQGLEGEDHDAVRARDAFLQRFGQATDHVLRKLFPRLQAAITGSTELLTIRELLEALHRAELIDAPQTWMEVLELRNSLIHEYALRREELADALNDAWRRAPVIMRQIDAARAFADRRGLLQGS